jgi:hypothetical protein
MRVIVVLVFLLFGLSDHVYSCVVIQTYCHSPHYNVFCFLFLLCMTVCDMWFSNAQGAGSRIRVASVFPSTTTTTTMTAAAMTPQPLMLLAPPATPGVGVAVAGASSAAVPFSVGGAITLPSDCCCHVYLL